VGSEVLRRIEMVPMAVKEAFAVKKLVAMRCRCIWVDQVCERLEVLEDRASQLSASPTVLVT
jgi:hypothetical protein